MSSTVKDDLKKLLVKLNSLRGRTTEATVAKDYLAIAKYIEEHSADEVILRIETKLEEIKGKARLKPYSTTELLELETELAEIKKKTNPFIASHRSTTTASTTKGKKPREMIEMVEMRSKTNNAEPGAVSSTLPNTDLAGSDSRKIRSLEEKNLKTLARVVGMRPDQVLKTPVSRLLSLLEHLSTYGIAAQKENAKILLKIFNTIEPKYLDFTLEELMDDQKKSEILATTDIPDPNKVAGGKICSLIVEGDKTAQNNTLELLKKHYTAFEGKEPIEKTFNTEDEIRRSTSISKTVKAYLLEKKSDYPRRVFIFEFNSEKEINQFKKTCQEQTWGGNVKFGDITSPETNKNPVKNDPGVGPQEEPSVHSTLKIAEPILSPTSQHSSEEEEEKKENTRALFEPTPFRAVPTRS